MRAGGRGTGVRRCGVGAKLSYGGSLRSWRLPSPVQPRGKGLSPMCTALGQGARSGAKSSASPLFSLEMNSKGWQGRIR